MEVGDLSLTRSHRLHLAEGFLIIIMLYLSMLFASLECHSFEISPSLPVASEKEHHHLDLVEGARTSMDCGCVQSFARRESLERDRRKRKQRDILTTMKAHT